MSFSKWYPNSSLHYDPAIQPTKAISSVQLKDQVQYKRLPLPHYNTTYRREYLDYNNSYVKPHVNQYLILPPIKSPSPSFNQQPQQQQQQQQQQHQQQQDNFNGTSMNTLSFNSHNINNNINNNNNNNNSTGSSTNNDQAEDQQTTTAMQLGARVDNYLPVGPIVLSNYEEQSLINEVARALGSYSFDQLKYMYDEIRRYDKKSLGCIHHTFLTMIASKHKLPLDESKMRFVMSKFVSPMLERGYVNYDNLVRFLSRCMNDQGGLRHQLQSRGGQLLGRMSPSKGGDISSPRSVNGNSEQFDPDEHAILRQLHENMREYDQVTFIDCENLRRRFYEIDPYNSNVLSQREIEDVLYKCRVPIQRSLIFKILENYCKVTTGQYRWPSFVEFLEKTYNFKYQNKTKTHYVIREGERSNDYSAPQFTYRTNQLDSLRMKTNEEERLEEINKQIHTLTHLQQETRQKMASRLDTANKNETWFTRFMRLANAMYNHRINSGSKLEFVLPINEARRLLAAYNTVYELNIPEETIENALTMCISKTGNVIIDDLLKILSKTSQ